MRPHLITNCTHILYPLSWIVYPALERKLGKEERMKGDAGAEATLILYELYKEITNKPLPKVQSALSFC